MTILQVLPFTEHIGGDEHPQFFFSAFHFRLLITDRAETMRIFCRVVTITGNAFNVFSASFFKLFI